MVAVVAAVEAQVVVAAVEAQVVVLSVRMVLQVVV
jgi:hypothetical protein